MSTSKFVRRLLRRFRWGKVETEMAEEMREHLALRREANVNAGMSQEDAEREARTRFGPIDSLKEEARDQRNGVWLELIFRDVALGFRQLLKSPAFSLTIIGTLALGMAACTVVFTAIDTALLHPVNSPDIDRYVIIHETKLPQVPQSQLSVPTYLDLERETKSFEYLGAWTGASYVLTGESEPVTIRGATVSPSVFRIMDHHLTLGRGFVADDFQPGRDHVVVLTPAFWKRVFGSSPDVVDRVLHFNNEAYTIIGVLSEEFSRLGSDIEVWTPMIFQNDQKSENQRGARFLQTQALLKRGVTIEQAQAELDLIARRIAEQHPQTNAGSGLLVRDFRAYLNRSLKPMLLLVLGAVACVMAIASANAANLLLARGSSRQREITIRAALGASRRRLIRQMLIESVMLSLVAGGAGVALPYWGLHFLHVYGPSAGTDLARLSSVALNANVLALTFGVSVFTGIVFGLAPAWLTSAVNLNDALKQGARGSTESRRRGYFRRTLVILEIALAVVLLSGAGMMVRNVLQLARVDPGFSPEQIAVMPLNLRMPNYAKPEARFNFATALLDRLQALPNVETAALTNVTPFNGPNAFFFSIVGRDDAETKNRPSAILYIVTPGYFKTMGIRVVRGQPFTGQVDPTGPPPVVVNETFARTYFADGDAVGQRVLVGKGPGQVLEIVAVVGDVMQARPDVPPVPQMYAPWRLGNPGGFFVVVRSRGDATSVLSAMKPQVYATDREQATGLPRPMSEMMKDAVAPQKLVLRILVIFAGIALLIAAVGIYGIIAYSVAQRTTEIGVRMALGATPNDIVRHFLQGGIKFIGAGLLLGLLAAVALGRIVQSVLFNSNARDPLVLLIISVLLCGVALLACFLPARRAAKVDPLVALRAD